LRNICEEISHLCIEDFSYIPEYITCALYLKAKLCSILKLRCVDVPVFTSSTMPFIENKDENFTRKFWKYLIKRYLNGQEVSKIKFFDNGYSKMYIALHVVKGPIYILRKHNIAVDKPDCIDECTLSTNTYKLYTYLEGEVESNYMRLNLVYLLKKLEDLGYTGFVDDLIELTLSILKLRKGDYQSITKILTLSNRILIQLKDFKEVISDVVFCNVSEIEKFVQPLRQVLKST